MNNPQLRVMYSDAEIQKRVTEIGAQITRDYKDRKSTRLNSSH